MKRFLTFLILLIASSAGAQVGIQTGNPIDRGPSLPTTCFVGQGPYFKTSASGGAVGIYGCFATNTWTALATGASSGTVTSSGSPVAGNIAKFTTATNIAPAAASDIVALFSTCSGTQYLGADGACHTGTGIDSRTACATDLAPVTGDDLLITLLDPATAVHLIRFGCGVTGTTSVVTNLVKATYSLMADQTCTAGDANAVTTSNFVNGSSQCGDGYASNCAVAAHAPVTIHVGTISATPTALTVCVDYTVD